MGTGLGQSLQQDPTFAEECRDVLQSLRGALIEALGAVKADAARPREAARKLGLDKNLIWKVSKIVGQPDVFQAVSHVPGRAGIEILAKALEKAGAPAGSIQRIREGMSRFEQMVKRHAGDRATLELVAGSFGPADHQRDALEHARKLAFKGNSAVWSVQARVQVATTLMAPNADDPSMVDVAQLAGLVDLRRLRPDVRWLLARSHTYDDASKDVRGEIGEPLDPATPEGGFPILRDFSSSPFPEVYVENLGDELHYELSEGPVGRTGEVTCIWGSTMRALGSQYADEDNRYSQIGANLITPVEHLQFDLLVHRDLDWAMNPKVAIYSSLDGRLTHVGMGREGVRLPVPEPVVSLGGGLTALATARMPRYSKLIDSVFDRVGWSASDFFSFRFEMAYPPIPAHAILYSELRPARGTSS